MESDKQKNLVLIIILMVAMLVIGLLFGYIIFELKDNSSNSINENKIHQDDKDNQDSEEEIPYFDGLKSITYNVLTPEDTYNSKISDSETMKKVLLIFKNKSIAAEPEGLGGAGSIYLILEYETYEMKFQIIDSNLVVIDNQYYNVNYEGNYYSILESIFK